MKTLFFGGLSLIAMMVAAGSQVIVETKYMDGEPDSGQTIKFILEGSWLRMHEAKAE